MSKQYTDWEGNLCEPPDPSSTDKVLAWQVTPCLHSPSYDCVVIRGWQEFSAYLEQHIANYLDEFAQIDLTKGISIKIQLVPVQPCELDDSEMPQ